MAYTINTVQKITEGDAQRSYLIIECNIAAPDPLTGLDETFDATHIQRDSDPHGLSPLFKQWIEDNQGFPIDAYVPPPPPTLEELRAQMPPLTARQLRLGFVGNDISLSSVTATIEAMPAGPDKEKAQIEWEYATTFNRMHPLIAWIGTVLGLSNERIDDMWTSALNL